MGQYFHKHQNYRISVGLHQRHRRMFGRLSTYHSISTLCRSSLQIREMGSFGSALRRTDERTDARNIYHSVSARADVQQNRTPSCRPYL